MRILLVEDDLETARSLARGLELEGYAVDVEPDGPSGLATALGGVHDLAVVDWVLPGLTGPVLCARLRSAGVTTPIILLTARDAVADRVHGLDSGADDYLAKPFSLDELSARIRALLRRPAKALPVSLVAGELTLHPDRRVAERDGLTIELTVREYGILELLMRRPGRVFSRRELIERIWDATADVLETTVESHVSQLRAKVDRPFAGPPVIATVWGRGYRVSP